MKNEPETKILIMIVFIVLIIFTVYMSLANEYKKNKVSSEANISKNSSIDPEEEYYKSLDNGSIPYEEPNRNEEEYKRPTKEENVKRYYPNLPSKIKSLGFTDISNDEKCRDIDYCYTNNVYNVNFGSSVWTEISKNLNEGDINNYDSSKDFEFIGSLFDVKFPSNLSDSVNKLLHTMNENINHYFSFNINAYGKYFYIRYSNNNISYSISDGLNSNNYDKGIFVVDDVNAIINTMPENNKKSIIKTMYDILMETNKDKYKYYDYVNNHFDEGVCAVDISEKNYLIKTSYCHGGTSNTSFELSHRTSGNNVSIETTVKTSYFSDSYLDFIKNDLSYFSEKLNVKLELSQENINDLDAAVKGKLENYSIKVSDKVIINLKYKFYNEYADYFYITYEFM